MNIYNTTVFSYDGKGGNPCPVVLDADKLTFDEMMDIAKEYKLEVGFVLKSEDQSCDYQFKYFVPTKEMEMCVHATIACVSVLKRIGKLNKSIFSVETLAGIIDIEIIENDLDFSVKVKQRKSEMSDQVIDKFEVAKALNISENQLLDYPIKNVSTSRFKLIVGLKNLDILNSLTPNYDYLWEVCEKVESTGFYPFVKEESNVYHARQFPNKTGYLEDSATGVAASALGVYVNDVMKHPFETIRVYQGFAMNSPSEITVMNGVESNFVIGKATIEE